MKLLNNLLLFLDIVLYVLFLCPKRVYDFKLLSRNLIVDGLKTGGFYE